MRRGRLRRAAGAGFKVFVGVENRTVIGFDIFGDISVFSARSRARSSTRLSAGFSCRFSTDISILRWLNIGIHGISLWLQNRCPQWQLLSMTTDRQDRFNKWTGSHFLGFTQGLTLMILAPYKLITEPKTLCLFIKPRSRNYPLF